MKDVMHFEPNSETHKEFAEALKEAKKQGVHIIAVDCNVNENSIDIVDYVKVMV